ncbi:MAG: ATP-binding cassette domain-containing protein, partial [bacterium]
MNNISVSCHEDEMLGLVGESGSGKTVLAGALVAHVRRPGRIVNGEVRYEGRNLLDLSKEAIHTVRGAQIGMIVSNAAASLNPLISVGEQVANIYRSHFAVAKREARDVALQAITETGINDPEARYRSLPHELSGGMAKRIIIAAALVLEPKILIADEPTSGLDVTIQAQVLDKMMELVNQKKTAGFLLMTRDLGIIAQYCTRVIVTYAGQVVE